MVYLLTKATNLCWGGVRTGDDVVQLQKVLHTMNMYRNTSAPVAV